jgi:stearoyl-CoA desaturase (delta-9 desaturase)
MTPRGHMTFFLAVSILPFVAFGLAVVLLWQRAIDGIDLGILVFMYMACTVGGTMGFHRLFSHRSFETSKPVRYSLAVLGTMSAQGSPITWVANHRKHHAYADEDGDPHSPHLEPGGGMGASLRGLWHAHMGWMWNAELRSEPMRYAPDLVRDPAMRRISGWFLPIVALGLLVPFAAGWILHGSFGGALRGLLWGGFVRLFFQQHMTYSVNSIGHFFGRRRFDTDDESRNVLWLSLPSLGDSWHHNHHAFPRSASHGLRWWELDPVGWMIRGLEKVGVVWNVVRIPPERQREKEQATAVR